MISECLGDQYSINIVSDPGPDLVSLNRALTVGANFPLTR